VYRRVLVPLDGSPEAEAILPFILQIAGPLDIDVVLLRVVPAVRESEKSLSGPGADVSAIDAREYLAPLAVELRGRGVRVEAMVRRGPPAAEIIAAAREVNADLVAMTTHGRTGLRRLAFGSVAELVLRRAALPVFLMQATAADVERRATRLTSP